MSQKRPKPGEDEDELLRQMKEFEASKSSISKENIVSFQKAKKPSKFAAARKAATESKISSPSENVVLKSVITEKEFNYDDFLKSMSSNPVSSGDVSESFPAVMKLDQIPAENAEKTSLFAQKMQKSTKIKKEIKAEIVINHERNRQWQSRLINQSQVLQNQDKQEIHEENIAKLNALSDKQIMEDRQQLLETMKPDLVAFLMQRKASKKRPKEDSIEKEMDSSEPPKKVLEGMKYLHMDKYETEKMEWMEEAPATSKVNTGKFLI